MQELIGTEYQQSEETEMDNLYDEVECTEWNMTPCKEHGEITEEIDDRDICIYRIHRCNVCGKILKINIEIPQKAMEIIDDDGNFFIELDSDIDLLVCAWVGDSEERREWGGLEW